MSILDKLDEEPEGPKPTRPPGCVYAIIDYFTGWYHFNGLANGDAYRNGRIGISVFGVLDSLVITAFQVELPFQTFANGERDISNYVLAAAAMEEFRIVFKTSRYLLTVALTNDGKE